ncbi:protein kinase family protein [Streptomyces sp. NPDC001250]|uniref:protein kinase family protein n=1 Tax=Streptomyces sp. NPDC001250 TaxID=3154382 RepID=UPI003323B1D9
MKCPDMSRGSRLTAHSAVSTSLALCSDRALRELMDAAMPIGSGIGGKSAMLEVAGTPVFVKRVPLTDPERQPEHVRSTANLFDLPVFCQYGIGTIGAPGFGAWRELAVHTMTTNWVLTAEHEGFPLMYHWRVLPDLTPLPEELADIGRAVAYWGGRSQVRRRIQALQQSSASVALFLEYIPQNLHQWLGTQLEAGDQTANQACAMVERELAAGTAFMNARGLLHFDAHFENILTDGRRLFFADYGLALSSGFELSQDEAEFFVQHQTYDRCYTAAYLVNWLVTALCGYQREDREGRYALVRAYAEGKRPTGIPEEAAAILARHAPIAAVMSDFNRKFQRQSRRTPYPLEEIRQIGGMYSSSIC